MGVGRDNRDVLAQHPESSPDGWIGRYDAAIGLSKFFFFCPDEIHEFDLGSWILKNAEKIPYENRVILRLLCAIHCFRNYVLLFFTDFVSKSLSNSIEVPFWTSIELDTDLDTKPLFGFFFFFLLGSLKPIDLSSHRDCSLMLMNRAIPYR